MTEDDTTGDCLTSPSKTIRGVEEGAAISKTGTCCNENERVFKKSRFKSLENVNEETTFDLCPGSKDFDATLTSNGNNIILSDDKIAPKGKNGKEVTQATEIQTNDIGRTYKDEISGDTLGVNRSLKTTVERKLPDPSSEVEPDAYLSQLIEAMFGVNLKVRKGLDLGDFFPRITEAQLAAYDIQVVTATRENDVVALRKFNEDHGRSYLDCVNRFGESLLHMACRRGFEDAVEFLLSDGVCINPRVIDDFGRTPLHDACWNPHPQLIICSRLIEKDPSLLLIADKRGATPFQYARPQDWAIWRKFLYENRNCLSLLMEKDVISNFS